MIPSSAFDLRRGQQPNDQSDTSVVGRKRDSSFFLTVPEFSIESADGKPARSILKALSLLGKAEISYRPNNLSNNDMKERTPNSDSLSVSTASTSSIRDEDSDMENDSENDVPITTLPPDALFMVQGKEFPCHTQLLSKEARPLLGILSRDGVLERKTKKRRTSSLSRDQRGGQEQPQAWSSTQGITVARLPNDVDSDSFQAFMEFLYTKEIRLKLPQGYHEDDEEDDPWLMDTEDIFHEDEEEEEDVAHPSETQSSQDEESTATSTPLKFLQEFFSLADRFGFTSLKNAIENKLYDEFLFSFTAKELYTWADQNDCEYLREKAMEKIPAQCSEKQNDSNPCSLPALPTSVKWEQLQRELLL